MRRRTIALVAATGAAAVALFGAGLLRGWWRVNHPSPARFPVWGLDVSWHQGDIDWPTVAGQPHIAFAYLKATEGGDWVDPRCRANWQQARTSGLRVGAYHFFTFCRPPLEQAAHFLATLPRDAGTLPPRSMSSWGETAERSRRRRRCRTGSRPGCRPCRLPRAASPSSTRPARRTIGF